jgi:hypothetical protein
MLSLSNKPPLDTPGRLLSDEDQGDSRQQSILTIRFDERDMDKQTVLKCSTFGSRVAEDEGDALRSYFVETDQWQKLFAGDVDIIYGAKGAGKSALYALLVGQIETFRLGRRIVFVAAENPRGTPAFRDLADDPPTTEEEFRGLWKLYFLTLVANYLRHHLETTRTSNPHAAEVIKVLVDNELLAPDLLLIGRLKAVLDYLRHRIPSLETTYTDPHTGVKVTGKITLAEPSNEQREHGFVSADDLLTKINMALRESFITVWLILDRLDVAFTDSHQLESNALRSLFRVYLDALAHSNIAVKIFLRDDIWHKISASGFREASHITRTLTISWNKQSLLNLIIRRLVYNQQFCTYYSVSKEEILRDAQLQSGFFYRVFPPQIDVGRRQPKTLDWMLSRVTDGSKRTAPREVIHLLSLTRDEQLKLYELGNAEPPSESLFDKNAIRASLPEVSRARYVQTLCAENPALKPYLDKLEGEKTEQTPESLSKLWNCQAEKTTETAELLTEAGFFERRRAKDKLTYWVPFLYRDALNLVQGTA